MQYVFKDIYLKGDFLSP